MSGRDRGDKNHVDNQNLTVVPNRTCTLQKTNNMI